MHRYTKIFVRLSYAYKDKKHNNSKDFSSGVGGVRVALICSDLIVHDVKDTLSVHTQVSGVSGTVCRRAAGEDH